MKFWYNLKRLFSYKDPEGKNYGSEFSMIFRIMMLPSLSRGCCREVKLNSNFQSSVYMSIVKLDSNVWSSIYKSIVKLGSNVCSSIYKSIVKLGSNVCSSKFISLL